MILLSLGLLLVSAMLYWRAHEARRDAKVFLDEALRRVLSELKAPAVSEKPQGSP